MAGDFAKLDELCAWMRSNGATSARVGDVALTLGSPPIVPVAIEGQPESSPDSPIDRERHELETLLHSCGGDATPFLRRRDAA